MGRWSDLPVNLMELIEDRLVLYVDKVRIRAVCVSWNSYLPKMPNRKERQFPWLLQALDNNIKASHALFNPVEKKFYLLDLPEAQGKLFKGSSHGWVATLEDTHSSDPTAVYLINPLTKAKIKLPSRNKFPDVRKYRADKVDNEYCLYLFEEGGEVFQFQSSDMINLSGIEKIVMSSDPSSDDCVIVAIYGLAGRLACCKLNDKKWKPLPLKDWRGRTDIDYVDIIFYKGKLHALLCTPRKLFAFENNQGVPNHLNVTQVARDLQVGPVSLPFWVYLVECSDGGLIMIERYFHTIDIDIYSIPSTYCFRVFKLDISDWVEVKDIGEDIMFVGCNTSFSISSRHSFGYKGNCIYFTDPIYSYGGKYSKQEVSDIGVFNLKDGTVQSLSGLECNARFLWPPPIWVNMV